MQLTMAARTQPGFTLIELLIAVTVLATLALIAWRGLDTLAATRTRLEPEAEELRTMVAVFGQLQIDYAQAADPQFISLTVPPITAGDGGNSALQIIRMAPREAEQAMALQRVLYTVRDGQLARAVSAPVRSAGLLAQAQLSSVPLLANIAALKVRAWKSQQWEDGASALMGTDMTTQLPAGIEVTLVHSNGTSLRKVLVTR